MPKINVKTVSQYTGVPEQTLYRWFSQEIIPDSEDLAEVTKAVVARYKELAVGKKDKTKDPLTDEKIRLTKAQADKIEVENQLIAGELLKAEDIESEWTNYVLSCRSRLLSIPSKLALELSQITDPNIVQKRLKTEVNQALDELSEISQSIIVNPENLAKVEATPDAVNK
jgi:phage terminase Nu1 subunit (DNA packaging protein)